MSRRPYIYQPYRNPAEQPHRVYVPATWAEPGEGGGQPKLDGGVTLDENGAPTTARGFNRPDSRYAQPVETIRANRATRATSEEPYTVVLRGANSTIFLRAPSGNNYDLQSDGTGCNCPDQLRLDASYGEGEQCKHSLIAQMKLTAIGGYIYLDWSSSMMAETLGCDVRTVENLCHEGKINAFKANKVWVIPYGQATWDFILDYQSKIVEPTGEIDIP